MKLTLYRLPESHDVLEGFWAVEMPIWIDASSFDKPGSVIVRMELPILNIFGQSIGRDARTVWKRPEAVLSPVGSFETPAQMIDLMTPTLVDRAWHRIQDEFLMTSVLHDLAIRKALTVRPYENACWILKATPEELQSWAETLARQPS